MVSAATGRGQVSGLFTAECEREGVLREAPREEAAVGAGSPLQRWRVQLALPMNPLPQTLCVAEGGEALADVIRAITRVGVSVQSPITLEREVIL